MYLSCAVITERHFKSYQGFDLALWDGAPTSSAVPDFYRVLRVSTVREVCEKIAAEKDIPAEKVRLWVLVNRQNKTVRPDQPLLDPDMQMEEAFVKHGSRDKYFRLWLEVAEDMEEGKVVWPEMQSQVGNNMPILVFLKYFNAEAQTLRGVGQIYVKKHAKVGDMVSMIGKKMGWSPDSMAPIALFEVFVRFNSIFTTY